MKYNFLLLLIFFATTMQGQINTLYPLKFKAIDKGNIHMNDYKGKKVIVVVCDAVEPDQQQLLSLDSLYKKNKKTLVVIAIPVEDFHSNAEAKKLKKLLLQQLNISFPITAISKAKKNTGNAQHELLQWLTNKESNKKMDKDVQYDGEIFVLNEKGNLYARLNQKLNVNSPFFLRILAQAVPTN
jgi:glutathione peroxidase-family protein